MAAESPATTPAELDCDGFSAAIHSPADLSRSGVTLYTADALTETRQRSMPPPGASPHLQPLHHLPPATSHVAPPPPPTYHHLSHGSHPSMMALSLAMPSEAVGYSPSSAPQRGDGGAGGGEGGGGGRGGGQRDASSPPPSADASYALPTIAGYTFTYTQSHASMPCTIAGVAMDSSQICPLGGTPMQASSATTPCTFPSYDYQSNGSCLSTYSSAFGPSSQRYSLGWMGTPTGGGGGGAYGGGLSHFPSLSTAGLPSHNTNPSSSTLPSNLFPHSQSGSSGYAPYGVSPLGGGVSQHYHSQPNTMAAFVPYQYAGSLNGFGMVDDSGNPRPQYSFSALIAMAIKSSAKQMLTLPEIYDFISQKFPYYNKEDKRWKNAVRHNLSLNKCFKKAPREDGYHGKGNFWIIDPACDHILENGSFRSPTKKKKGKKTKSSKKLSGRASSVSKETNSTDRTETEAVIDLQTSTAETVIPPIENGTNGASNGYGGFYGGDSGSDGLHFALGPSSPASQVSSPDVSLFAQVGKLDKGDRGGGDDNNSSPMADPSSGKALNFPVERLLS